MSADENMTKAQRRALDKMRKKRGYVVGWTVRDGLVVVERDDDLEPTVAIAPNGLVEPR